MCCLERIEVALFLHYFKRCYGVNVLFAVLSCISSNQFQTDSIVQTLLVDNVGNGVFLTAFERAFHQFFRLFAGYDFDAVPLGHNFFLPCCEFLGFGIVVGSQCLEAFCFLGVELAIVIVQLTLHCVVRRNLRDGVLDGSDPAFGISLLVACIVQRQDFIFQNTIDSSSIQLVLMLLVLISTFFCQRPSCTFTVAFQPPSVEYREVHNTIHQSFLA